MRLGYRDNRTGACVPQDGHATELGTALSSYDSDEAGLPALVPAVPEQRTADTVADPAYAFPTHAGEQLAPPGHDLAAVSAGAAARRQAVELRQAAPLRTFIARVLGAKTDERAWRIGADGEEAVAKKLARLGPAWRVLHAVPVGDRGSDIDHVVIGPGGVFTLNTKHHPGARVWVGGDTFLVDGHRQPYVRNSRHEARRAARLLSAALEGRPVAVTGLVVVMGATGGFTVKAQPEAGDVVVVRRRDVVGWLERRPEALDVTAVDALYEIARRSTTWS